MGYFSMPPINASVDDLVDCAEQNLRLWHEAKANGGYEYLLDMAATQLKQAAARAALGDKTPNQTAKRAATRKG